MDRPNPARDHPSDEGLMTLGRGLGLEGPSSVSSSTSTSSPQSAAPAPSSPSSASGAPSSSSSRLPNGYPTPTRSTSLSRPIVRTPSSADPAGTTAGPAASSVNSGPGPNGPPPSASASPSSSYQRRMPSSPLSKTLDGDASPAPALSSSAASAAAVRHHGAGTRSPRSLSAAPSPSTSPPTTTATTAVAAAAAGRAARPMSLPPPAANSRSKASGAGGQPLASPCFVHGNLGHSVTLQDWLERRPAAAPSPVAEGNGGALSSSSASADGPAAAAAAAQASAPSPALAKNETTKVEVQTDARGKSVAVAAEDDDDAYDQGLDAGDEDAGVESLTRQLAETAVGVREMSKQLGRTRVRSNIQSILIITKARDNRLIKLTRELAIFLMGKQRPGSGENRRGHTVYVDAQLRTSKRFDAAGIEAEHPEFFVPVVRRRSSSSASVNTLSGSGFGSDASGAAGQNGDGQLRYWTSDMCAKTPHLFDFVVTLGGDGTVLFTSWLFQKIVPPVLPFALGSLGFLTNFDFANYAAVMSSAIDNGIRVNLRMRFTCTVYRAIRPEDNEKGLKAVRKVGGEILMSEVGKAGWEALEGGLMHAPGGSSAGAGAAKDCKEKREKEIMCFSTRPVETFEVLNDLVVDRGPSPYVSMLELFGDEHHMTTVQADGLTISTPTGSTAYSLSAGGSLVHPEIPAILITPICPHTLSFRPMLLPDSMELRICVPYNSRSTAWASFDGRGRVELKQGDHIKVTASQYPFPTVCADKQSTDWFQAIQRTLRWNDREKQKSFVFVEEPRNPVAPKPLRPPASSAAGGGEADEPLAAAKAEPIVSAGLDADDDDKETFDIDDSSTAAPSAMNSPPHTPQSQAAVQPTFSDGLTSAQESHDRRQPPSPDEEEAAPAADESWRPTRSGIQTPGRFADPLAQPHPSKLNIRHIVGALSTLDGGDAVARRRAHHAPSKPPALKRRNSTPAPIKVVPRPEGEEGQRDDIHDPTAQRASKSRIPKSSERERPAPGSSAASPVIGSADATPPTTAGAAGGAYDSAGQTPRPHEKMRRHGSPRHHHHHRPSAATARPSSSSAGPGLTPASAGDSGARAFAFYGAWSGSDSSLSESDEY